MHRRQHRSQAGHIATGVNVWEVHINGGRVATGLEAVAWAREVERLGAGEIVLTSMDADGTQNGYDLEMTRAVVESVRDPGRGLGRGRQPRAPASRADEAGASAALAASIFHYQHYSIRETKEYLASRGVPVRMTDLRSPRGPQTTPRNMQHSLTPDSRVLATEGVHLHGDGQLKHPLTQCPNEPEANKLFRMVMRFKGSDLHLKVGMAPAMRLAGVLRLMQLPQLTGAEMERLMFPLLSARQKNHPGRDRRHRLRPHHLRAQRR